MRIVWKHLGETPLEALERVRKEEGILSSVPMTYAGRLDPAAEGKLIILVGDECKNKESYSAKDKTYIAEILLGVSTDTHDLLGMPTLGAEKKITQEMVTQFVDEYVGTKMQSYPAYSSKTVDGKQLHAHAREGNDVALPEHEVTLYSYENLNLDTCESEDVLTRVGELVAEVRGDFRQKEILESWGNITLPEKLSFVSITITVSSGFYVRQFAEDLGKSLGVGACLYSLVRTEIK